MRGRIYKKINIRVREDKNAILFKLLRVVLETERISTRDRVKERESMRESQEREEREIECGREKYDNKEYIIWKQYKDN